MLVKYEDLLKIFFVNNVIEENFVGWKFLKQLFRENFNIRYISFKNSNLTDKTFEIIISSLLTKRIRYLNLANNKITNAGMNILNQFLIKNNTLSVLNMSNNKEINRYGIKLILNSLKLHPNILKLDLSYMQLEESGPYISSLLKENKTLNVLILKNDKLNDKDIQFISKELIKNDSTLEHLDLSENVNLGTEGFTEIGNIIHDNKSLKSIKLDGMNLNMNNYLPIFNGIYKNKNIEYYSIGRNADLPLKGVLNFFQKKKHIKKINIIPWKNRSENKFTEEENFLLERFHLKAPDVILEGINFISS